MTHLLIVGGGGHGRVVADTIRQAGTFSKIVFLDPDQAGCSIAGIPCHAPAELPQFAATEWRFVVAIGDNNNREHAYLDMVRQGYEAVTVVHPWSYVSLEANIGAGCMVLAGSVVQTGARIGRGVIVNNNATVEHDCLLDDFVHMATGAVVGGNVKVGKRALIGSGALIRKGASIAPDVVLGVGSVAVSDIVEAGIYIGIPARRI